MKNIYLLTILLFSFTWKVKANETMLIKSDTLDLTDLVRISYDLEDNPIFFKLCTIMTDSILAKEAPVQMNVLTDIVEYHRSLNQCESVARMNSLTSVDTIYCTIDWSLSYYEDELFVAHDRLSYTINLSKEGFLKIEGKPAEIFEIENLRDSIYSPVDKNGCITHIKEVIDQVGEVDVPVGLIIFEVNIREWNHFYVDEWRLFFNCLNKLIDVVEKQRDLVSLKLWGKTFDSMTFDEKMAAIDIIGHNIRIKFQ